MGPEEPAPALRCRLTLGRFHEGLQSLRCRRQGAVGPRIVFEQGTEPAHFYPRRILGRGHAYSLVEVIGQKPKLGDEEEHDRTNDERSAAGLTVSPIFIPN